MMQPAGFFIPGFSEGTTRWQELLPARWRVINQPGHGLPPAAPYDEWLAQILESIRATMEARQETFWLGGYSMGGRLALQIVHQLAVQQPALLPRLRLLLLSTRTGLFTPSERSARRDKDAAIATRLRRDGLDAFSDWWSQVPVLQPYTPWSSDEIEGQRQERQQHNSETLATTLVTCSPGALPDMAPFIKTWRQAGLRSEGHCLLVGANDEPYQEPMTAIAAALSSDLHAIADCRHAIHREQPAALNDILSRLIVR
ncbi:MAG: alpha/beta fold hydrolase [Erythrobacter sp.]|nr:alpha/beta fold hydrolase [Erythrobacter sp.]